MPLTLSLPVKPFHLNQPFGKNPLNADGTPYYSKFTDSFGNPLKGHNGADLMATHGEPVYAPCDGNAFYQTDQHGGDGIIIRIPAFDYEGQQVYGNIILWHLCAKDDPQFPIKINTDGSATSVKKGDLIGYADNSGAPYESSGDHLHWAVVPTDVNQKVLFADNGFNGCIDPMQFWDSSFAGDIHLIPVIQQAVTTASGIVQDIETAPISNTDKSNLLAQIKKVVEFFKSLL